MIQQATQQSYISPSGSITVLYNPSTGKVDYGAAEICAITVTQTSDKRLKSNVRDMNTMLNSIRKLRPTTYRRLDRREGTLPEMGFIAQDVAKVFPQLVSLNDNPHEDISSQPYLTLNHIGLIPILTKGILEIEAENGQLKKRILEMENQIDDQNAAIDQIINRLSSMEKLTELGGIH